MVTAQAGQGYEAPTRDSLDLRAFVVQAHFAQMRSTPLMAALFGMDSVDRWAVDFGEDDATLEEAMRIRAFVDSLGQAVEQTLPVLDQAADLLANLAAHLTTSRCIYLLRYVGSHNPGFIGRLAALLEGEDNGAEINVIRQRLATFARNEALARIFSPQAIEKIGEIMESYE